MRIHDWSRVDDGTFHHFHHSWIEEIQRVLNGGLLPPWLYALAEQQVSEFGPDVLALEIPDNAGGNGFDKDGAGTGLMVAPPKVKMTAQGSAAFYTQKQKSVVVHHASDDRIVAIIEVVSSGNKSSQKRLASFVRKACSLLHQGIHLLILDLHRPSRSVPEGIHGAIWSGMEEADYHQPTDKPLTLVSYEADRILGVTAYIEPIAVGDPLPEMPLYVSDDGYVSVPLQETYDRAFAALPRRWASVLE